MRACTGRSRRTCRRRSASYSSTNAPSTPYRPARAVYGSWRLAVSSRRTRHTCRPGLRRSVPARTRSMRGLGKAWWSLTGERTDRYRFMVFPKQHSRRSTRADARHIDLEYERIPRLLSRRCTASCSAIAVRPEIAAAAAEWAAANLDARRRRRASAHLARRRPPAPQISPAVVAPARRGCSMPPRSARFLVVSDSDDVAPMLAQRYGDAPHAAYPARDAARRKLACAGRHQGGPHRHAALARTRRLFASYLSTFSEVAWWLGGTTARVSVF